MRHVVTLLLLALLGVGSASARESAGLQELGFLAGKFEGTGKHPWGTYDETIEAAWSLDESILELRSKSTMQGRTVFEDLRVFSWDTGRKAFRMRQWSRGLLREYTGRRGKSGGFVFEETAREGAADDTWRYTFTPVDGGGFSYRVESKRAEAWKPYVSGTLTAAVKDPSKGGGMGMRQYETTIDGMDAQVHHPDGDGPFPAIVFSPGGGASTFQGYRPYGRWYATWGFVTVITAFDDASAEERAPKFSKVADWLVKENAREGSPLHGLIDTARLAAAGHSRGGNAALRAARADARFRACLALAPSGPKERVEGKGAALTCVIAGEKDDGFLEAGKQAFASTPGERTLVVVAGMEHMLTPREATLQLVARSTSFLNYALAGKGAYRALLRAEGSGVTITSHDE